MWCGPNFVDEDQFVLGAIKCPHAAIGLVPNAKLFLFGKGGSAGREQRLHATPVHADVGNSPVLAPSGGKPQGL